MFPMSKFDKEFPQSCFVRHENGEVSLLLNADDMRLLSLDLKFLLAFAARASRCRMSTPEQVALRKLEDLMRSIETARSGRGETGPRETDPGHEPKP